MRHRLYRDCDLPPRPGVHVRDAAAADDVVANRLGLSGRVADHSVAACSCACFKRDGAEAAGQHRRVRGICLRGHGDDPGPSFADRAGPAGSRVRRVARPGVATEGARRRPRRGADRDLDATAQDADAAGADRLVAVPSVRAPRRTSARLADGHGENPDQRRPLALGNRRRTIGMARYDDARLVLHRRNRHPCNRAHRAAQHRAITAPSIDRAPHAARPPDCDMLRALSQLDARGEADDRRLARPLHAAGAAAHRVAHPELRPSGRKGTRPGLVAGAALSHCHPRGFAERDHGALLWQLAGYGGVAHGAAATVTRRAGSPGNSQRRAPIAAR